MTWEDVIKPTPEELGIDPAALAWERSGDEDGSIEVAFPLSRRWVRGDWVLIFTDGTSGGLDELDVGQVALELTYREATDLRWFVDVLRAGLTAGWARRSSGGSTSKSCSGSRRSWCGRLLRQHRNSE